MAPFDKADAGLLAKQPGEGRGSSCPLVGSCHRSRCPVTAAPAWRQARASRGSLGRERVEGQGRHGGDFVQQQAHPAGPHAGSHRTVQGCPGLAAITTQQGRNAEDLAVAGQGELPGGRVGNVRVEHGHRPGHGHFVSHSRRHPDRPLRRHHPVALAAEHCNHAASGIGKLPALMGVLRKVLPVRVVIGRDDSIAGCVS